MCDMVDGWFNFKFCSIRFWISNMVLKHHWCSKFRIQIFTWYSNVIVWHVKLRISKVLIISKHYVTVTDPQFNFTPDVFCKDWASTMAIDVLAIVGPEQVRPDDPGQQQELRMFQTSVEPFSIGSMFENNRWKQLVEFTQDWIGYAIWGSSDQPC